MTLLEAIAGLLGPICAESARIIDEGDPDTELTVMFYGRPHRLTLKVLQDLDRTYAEAFKRAQKAHCTRRDRKAVGRLV